MGKWDYSQRYDIEEYITYDGSMQRIAYPKLNREPTYEEHMQMKKRKHEESRRILEEEQLRTMVVPTISTGEIGEWANPFAKTSSTSPPAPAKKTAIQRLDDLLDPRLRIGREAIEAVV